MKDVATRLNELVEEVRPLGGQVVEQALFNPDLPQFAGFLSVDEEHSPLHDIPFGYLVVGTAESEVMLRHRILMSSETAESSREGCRRVWAIAARVAQRAERGGVGSTFIAASLPPRPASHPPIKRRAYCSASGPLHPRMVESSAMDLVCSLLQHRSDLDVNQFRTELVLYVARPWPPGVSHPVGPWEVSIPAPGGTLIGWRIPDAAVQAMIDDAVDLDAERNVYRRLAQRI